MFERWLVLLFGIYFLPSLIALIRRHNLPAVAALNVLLGWTFVGWVVALVWSLSSVGTGNRSERLSTIGTAEGVASRVLTTVIRDPNISEGAWEGLLIGQSVLLKRSSDNRWMAASEAGILGHLDADAARVVEFRSQTIGNPKARVIDLGAIPRGRIADSEIRFEP